jgi:hypothetical protein
VVVVQSAARTGMTTSYANQWKKVACVAWTVALIFVSRMDAAELLKAELTSVATQPRAGAPMWVEVKLTSKSTRLREGALEFTHRVLGEPQWTYTTQELALTGGPQSFRFLLPPPQTREMDDRSLRVRFIEKGASSDLGLFPITTQARPGWPLTIATGPSSARAVGDLRPTWLNFRLERFATEKLSGATPIFSTGAAVLEPGDFPTDPIGYCAFDAVLLEGADFARVKEKSLGALGQWLAAGGALLVTADAVLDDAHAGALRRWIESDPGAARVQFDPNGKRIEPADGFSFARAGFGRVAVAPQRPTSEKAYDEEQWRRAVSWIWKLRTEQIDSVVRSGAVNYVPAKHGYAYDADYRFHAGIGKLTESLLPKTVRVMPRSVVIALLAGFVFLIGPLDWWLLGKLRARRFTWLLFPAVTAGVTLATMKLARHYLGEGHHRGALVVTDIAPDGRVVRETRLDVLLPAERGTLALDLQRSLCLPVLPVRYDGGNLIAGVSFNGSFPNNFKFTRPLQQWSPVLTRQTRIGMGEDRSGMQWSAFRREMLTQERPWEAARILTGDSDCSVAFVNRAGVGALDSQMIAKDLFEALIYTPQAGRFGLFSHVSPSGSSMFEDLPCVERDDEQSTLVIAARREGSELHLWRRLYLY